MNEWKEKAKKWKNLMIQGTKRTCRECANERVRTHYHNNIEAMTERNKTNREKMRLRNG